MSSTSVQPWLPRVTPLLFRVPFLRAAARREPLAVGRCSAPSTWPEAPKFKRWWWRLFAGTCLSGAGRGEEQ